MRFWSLQDDAGVSTIQQTGSTSKASDGDCLRCVAASEDRLTIVAGGDLGRVYQWITTQSFTRAFDDLVT